MWLEEEAVHVGQLHLIIVKQQQLQGKKSQTQQKEAWQSVTAEPRHVSRGYVIGFLTVLQPALHERPEECTIFNWTTLWGAPRYRLANQCISTFDSCLHLSDKWHRLYILDIGVRNDRYIYWEMMIKVHYLTNATSGEHFCSDTPHPSNSHYRHSKRADFLRMTAGG